MSDFVADLLILLDKEIIEFKNFIEFLALRYGLKHVVRLVVDESTCRVIDHLCNCHGITCLKSDFGLRLSFSTPLMDRFYEIVTADSPGSEHFVIFCGNKDSVLKACSVEREGCDAEETARIYGYPKCCAQNYQRIQNGEHWIVPYLTNVFSPGPYSWMNNKIAYLFQPHLTIFPDYFPCSVDCQETRSLSSQYRSLLDKAGLGSLLTIVKDSLKLPLFLYDGYIYQFSNLEFQSGRYSNRGNTAILSYAGGNISMNHLSIREVYFPETGVIDIQTADRQLTLEISPGSTEFIFFV